MKIQNLIASLFSLFFFISCGTNSEEHKILHEAFDVHLEALEIKKEMEPDLQQLRHFNNSIQVQGKALSNEEMNFTKSISSLESRLRNWEENHVEVPGFEHEGHDHSGHDHSGHDHSHTPKLQIPASDILIIQKEFKDSILAIKGTVGTLLSKVPE